MRKTWLSIALVALIGAPAWAQGGGTSTMPKNSGGIPEAPVGHRQPRASDFPSDSASTKSLNDPNSARDKEDAALDRKIKSICRGC